MRKGFPRPKVVMDDDTQWMSSKGKTFPAPYTAKTATSEGISFVHDGRLVQCMLFSLCIVCGELVKPNSHGYSTVIFSIQDKHFAVLKNGIHREAGPLHSKCGTLTMAMCPAMQDGKFSLGMYPHKELLQALHTFH